MKDIAVSSTTMNDLDENSLGVSEVQKRPLYISSIAKMSGCDTKNERSNSHEFGVADFIDMVQCKPILWDTRINLFDDDIMSNQLWEKIGNETGLSGIAAQLKFETLKTEYVKCRSLGIIDPVLKELSFLDPVLDYKLATQTEDDNSPIDGKESFIAENRRNISLKRKIHNLSSLPPAVKVLKLAPLNQNVTRNQAVNSLPQVLTDAPNNLNLSCQGNSLKKKHITPEGTDLLITLVKARPDIWRGRRINQFPCDLKQWIPLTEHFDCLPMSLYNHFMYILKTHQSTHDACNLPKHLKFLDFLVFSKMPFTKQSEEEPATVQKSRTILNKNLQDPAAEKHTISVHCKDIDTVQAHIITKPVTQTKLVHNDRPKNPNANRAIAHHIALSLSNMDAHESSLAMGRLIEVIHKFKSRQNQEKFRLHHPK